MFHIPQSSRGVAPIYRFTVAIRCRRSVNETAPCANVKNAKELRKNARTHASAAASRLPQNATVRAKSSMTIETNDRTLSILKAIGRGRPRNSRLPARNWNIKW